MKKIIQKNKIFIENLLICVLGSWEAYIIITKKTGKHQSQPKILYTYKFVSMVIIQKKVYFVKNINKGTMKIEY